MARKILTVKYFNGGIGDSDKEGLRGSFYLARNLEIFYEPTNLTLQPKTTKDSGTTVADLVKWCVSGSPHDTNTYFYGSAGKIYKRTSAGEWSLLQTTSNSGGQGFEIYDDYIYYTQDTQVGRYGPLSGEAAFDDDWQTSLNDTSNTDIAPIKAFAGGLAVANGNDLGWWDGATWDQDHLVFPPGYNIRSLEVIDEFLAIGVHKGTSVSSSDSGIVFFWDGASTTYNFFVIIPEGGINAIVNSRNRLLTIVGASAEIYLNYQPFQKVHRIPYLANNKYVTILPGAVGSWRGQTLIGVSGVTDDASLPQGVYQWGSKSDKYNETLNLAYTPSHGETAGTDIKIGCVKGLGDTLFIGWQHDTTYGVDKITTAASPFASGTYESLIFDDNRCLHPKQALTLKATHKPLVTGESVQLGYKVNRAASYTTDTANSTVGSTETRLPIPNADARFLEFQFECILATSVSTSPTITSIGLEYETLESEVLV
jgi:hypothetical protein